MSGHQHRLLQHRFQAHALVTTQQDRAPEHKSSTSQARDGRAGADETWQRVKSLLRGSATRDIQGQPEGALPTKDKPINPLITWACVLPIRSSAPSAAQVRPAALRTTPSPADSDWIEFGRCCGNSFVFQQSPAPSAWQKRGRVPEDEPLGPSRLMTNLQDELARLEVEVLRVRLNDTLAAQVRPVPAFQVHRPWAS